MYHCLETIEMHVIIGVYIAVDCTDGEMEGGGMGGGGRGGGLTARSDFLLTKKWTIKDTGSDRNELSILSTNHYWTS